MARCSARISLLAAAASGLCLLLLASVTAPRASAASCGSSISKSTGGYWQCTWNDDFSNPNSSRSKWTAQQTDQTGFTDPLQKACYVNSPNNTSISGGTLKLTARKEAAPFTCKSPYGNFTTQYTSGMVSTYGRFAQTYGRFEIRAKTWASRLPGLQTALWLWPLDANKYGPWPASGEIDVAEMYSAWADRAIPYIHYNDDTVDPNATKHDCMISNLAAFHTYAVEWTSATIKVLYDGQTCLIDSWSPLAPLTRPQPFNQPFIIALTQGFSTDFDSATTQLPATTEVDYVRVWK